MTLRISLHRRNTLGSCDMNSLRHKRESIKKIFRRNNDIKNEDFSNANKSLKTKKSSCPENDIDMLFRRKSFGRGQQKVQKPSIVDQITMCDQNTKTRDNTTKNTSVKEKHIFSKIKHLFTYKSLKRSKVNKTKTESIIVNNVNLAMQEKENLIDNEALECYNNFKSSHDTVNISSKNSDTNYDKENKDSSNLVKVDSPLNSSSLTPANDDEYSLEKFILPELNTRIASGAMKKESTFNIKKWHRATDEFHTFNITPFSPLVEKTTPFINSIQNITFLEGENDCNGEFVNSPIDSIKDSDMSFDNNCETKNMSSDEKTECNDDDNNMELNFSISNENNMSDSHEPIDYSKIVSPLEESCISVSSDDKTDSSQNGSVDLNEQNFLEMMEDSNVDLDNNDDSDAGEIEELEELEENGENGENVMCLVVPTFRDEQWFGLTDYIKGYVNKSLSQIDILEDAIGRADSLKKTFLPSKMDLASSDIRNPDFFCSPDDKQMLNEALTTPKNENWEKALDETSFFSFKDHDVEAMRDTIRSVGYYTNDTNSKLKFNNVSEVFYYDETKECKTDNSVSIIEAKPSTPNPVDISSESSTEKIIEMPLVDIKQSLPDPSNLPSDCKIEIANSNEPELMLIDTANIKPFLDTFIKSQDGFFSMFENDSVKIKDSNGAWTFDDIKRLFEEEDNSLYLGNSNNPLVQYRTQIALELKIDETLADVESMDSPDLYTQSKQYDLYTKKQNEQNNLNTKQPKTIENHNNNTLQVQDKKIDSVSNKSILKLKHNKNEEKERQTSELESAEKLETFLIKLHEKDDLRQANEPSLSEARAFQLKNFYSEEFYPNMYDDEEFVRSVKATQKKINYNIFDDSMLSSQQI